MRFRSPEYLYSPPEAAVCDCCALPLAYHGADSFCPECEHDEDEPARPLDGNLLVSLGAAIAEQREAG